MRKLCRGSETDSEPEPGRKSGSEKAGRADSRGCNLKVNIQQSTGY